MPNHVRVLQGRFFPAKLETEGDDAIFNTLLSDPIEKWTAAEIYRRELGGNAELLQY
jgi:hypothetical protein